MSGWFFDPLPMFGFDLVVFDPPSDFQNYSAKGEKKGPRAQYETMSDAEVAALPVGQLVGPNSWCLLWATAPKLDVNIGWLRGWGFRFVTEIVWRKVYPSGKPAMGTGYVARTMHESVLVGAIGSPAYRKPFPSLFDGVRRQHSRKPEEFYRLIDEQFAPAHMRRADIFSRQPREGWASFGKEANKFDEVADVD